MKSYASPGLGQHIVLTFKEIYKIVFSKTGDMLKLMQQMQQHEAFH